MFLAVIPHDADAGARHRLYARLSHAEQFDASLMMMPFYFSIGRAIRGAPRPCATRITTSRAYLGKPPRAARVGAHITPPTCRISPRTPRAAPLGARAFAASQVAGAHHAQHAQARQQRATLTSFTTSFSVAAGLRVLPLLQQQSIEPPATFLPKTPWAMPTNDLTRAAPCTIHDLGRYTPRGSAFLPIFFCSRRRQLGVIHRP